MSETTNNLSAQAKALKEGETISRAHRMLFEDFNAKKAQKKLASLRNSMNQIAARTRESTTFDYKVESGQFVTYDGLAMMLVVTLTCVADDGEDDI